MVISRLKSLRLITRRRGILVLVLMLGLPLGGPARAWDERAVRRVPVDQPGSRDPRPLVELDPPVINTQNGQPAWVESVIPLPAIQEMIDQVTPSLVSNYDGGLSGEWPVTIGGSPYTIMTRYSRSITPVEKATQYVFEHFESLSLDTYYQYFTLSGSQKRNVVAEQPGIDQPERVFMVTAHLDDYSGDPYNYAPGADDNASGSSAVLIAADILSQYTFDCTLRYALFTGEEQGLVGSQAYAQQAFLNGDNIEGVLNLDMIGYNSDDSPVIELHTRTNNASDLAIANLLADVVSAYQLNLTPEIQPFNFGSSDHASFWDYGYPAILAIEDFDDFNPSYHTTGDVLAILDLTYFTNFVKAAVGTMAHLGCLRPPDYPEIALTPNGLDLQAFMGQVVTRTLTISNLGGDSLTWSLVEQPEVNWLDVSPVAGVIGSLLEEDVQLSFSVPAVVGEYTTTLQVASNDADEPLLGVPITLTVPWAAFFPLIAAGVP